ncbi:hypothetical protein SRB5_70850 [Streptomyces sp. RB5]|uniref:Uncharacterized protein n=1 Tax=Streptomyces smaragdinus TaxID=2585196 RepID=A0A7K0CV71_9ACTN|nr:hypothetical protein [Streptomyces smaragdinus]MQY16882.1 hypothetical protein [Streptomyces smaragdinus]
MSQDDDYDGDYDSPYGERQTRTRLPESSRGSGRSPSARAVAPGRGVAAVVGIVVLLIAAIAFVNRGGDSGSSSEGGSGGSSQKGGTSPTAPSGERPVQGANSGIPAGFAKTEEGAQSAAANYAVALGGTEMFDAEGRATVAEAVYTPDALAKRKDALDKVYSDEAFLKRIGLTASGQAPRGMTFVSRTNPVGTRTEDFGGNRATVSVWYSSLFGLAGEGATNPVSESWYTSTFELQWVNGDWKVSDFTQKDGPTPVGRDQRASSAEEMADAVEGFGGLTYAR